MRTIVLSLCDNDFRQTLHNILVSIQSAIDARDPKRPFTEEQIKELIHEGVKYHYMAFSNWAFEPEMYPTNDATVEYLSKMEVLFDDAAEEKMLQDHDGGSAYLYVHRGLIGFF